MPGIAVKNFTKVTNDFFGIEMILFVYVCNVCVEYTLYMYIYIGICLLFTCVCYIYTVCLNPLVKRTWCCSKQVRTDDSTWCCFVTWYKHLSASHIGSLAVQATLVWSSFSSDAVLFFLNHLKHQEDHSPVPTWKEKPISKKWTKT